MGPQPQSMEPTAADALIAYGSNLGGLHGEPMEIVEIARRMLSSKGFCILQDSGPFRSPAYPPGAGPDFVNGVIRARTRLRPAEALAALHEIEAALGRERQERWAARTIDLDLLDYEGRVLPDAETHALWRALPVERQRREAPAELILPHPRLQDRAFVLVPLARVAPGWCHPVLGSTAAELLEALPAGDVAAVVPLAG